jgi:plastocyanin
MSGQSTTIKFESMKVMQNVIRCSVLAIGAILYGQAASVLAANVNVSSGDFFFSPKAVNINTGDSVTWMGLPAGGHTTTSSTGLWNSSANNFVFTFTTVGTFNYFCIPHQSLGMVGSVTVNAAAPPNVPPTVSITSPISGTVFGAPANVTIQASAADSDGSVTNVEFLVGSTVLANKAAAPFSAIANTLPAGSYTLSAIASDNLGAKATNFVVVSVINPSPLSISAPAVSSTQNNFQFSYASDIGLTYVVQVSTDLASGWTPIATNKATVNPTIFTTPSTNSGGSFYRVGRLPNP